MMEKAASNQSLQPSSKHPWDVPALADLDERLKAMLITAFEEEDNAGDTFAERAEWYYEKRPQLLALLKDLYNGYITLLNSCSRSQSTLSRHPSQVLAIDHICHIREEEYDAEASQIDSDAECSLSYQQPISAQNHSIDDIVADLVIENMKNDLLKDQLNDMDTLCHEALRKIDLLKKLLELLESERMVLLNENAGLRYRVSALLEENEGLLSESMFMKRRAAEMARCVLKMREDHRVCMLNQKIDNLQEQIYGLEKKNKEYYQQLVKRHRTDKEERSSNLKGNGKSIGVPGEALGSEGYFHFEVTKRDEDNGGKKEVSWWKRVKTMNFFICGLHQSYTF
ncbi:kinase-interacting family protein-like isoform X1 [Tripterygium wilfordii]|uniref:kinase-interacting family protein-like isoform X1 n=3 Tax=Tripterygium wilfordii TaxID=458696 RepID=UPI0018F80C74|nr:kinase-interacting family protein-like isoform X1 [Tripterygium wilfordii]